MRDYVDWLTRVGDMIGDILILQHTGVHSP